MGELARPFDMALPSLMKHIRVLETGGLVESEKHGRVRTCRLMPGAMKGAESWLAEQRAIWEARLDRLESYVATLRRSRQGEGVVTDAPSHTTSSKAQEIAMTSTPDAALAHWDIEREIVLSRVIKAKRDVVFAAWTEPEHLPNWFGPAGFKIETKEIDIRVGGVWRFDMLAPNGQRFQIECAFGASSRRT